MSSIELLVTRPVEHDDDEIVDVAAEAPGDRLQVVRTGASRLTWSFDARPDDELLHVEVGRVQQAALLGRGQHGDGIRRAGRAEVRAFERIDGDVDLRETDHAEALDRLWRVTRPTFSPMYSIGASSRSPSPMTIVPSIGTAVHDLAHRLDGDLIGLVAVALSHRVRARDRRLLDDAEELE